MSGVWYGLMARCTGSTEGAFVFKDEYGKPLKQIGVNIDITERKRAEEALTGERGDAPASIMRCLCRNRGW